MVPHGAFTNDTTSPTENKALLIELALVTRRNQTEAVSDDQSLGPIAYTKLSEQPALQALHGLYADAECASRLFHRMSAIDRIKDLPFPPGELDRGERA